MSEKIPEEELGECGRCGQEFRRARLGQIFCCNGCGNGQNEHTQDCRRKGTKNFLEKPARDYTLEAKAGEILWYLQTHSNPQGNPNLLTTATAALNYKGAQLNYEAAEKVASYTKALAWLTGALALVGIGNIIAAILN